MRLPFLFCVLGSLLAELVIEVGPTLAALITSTIASIIGVVMSWLAYSFAAKAREQSKENFDQQKVANDKQKTANEVVTSELDKIHTAVNSNATKMAAELRETKDDLLELSKLLVESQANAAHQSREHHARVMAPALVAAPTPTAIGDGTKIEMRVEEMEVKAMKVHDPKEEEKP